MLHFVSLSSGSNGNSYYFGNEKYGIVVDAGIGARTIKKRLKSCQIEISTIVAIFVTHDHADHIKGIGCLSEEYHIPVYSTRKILFGANRNYKLSPKVSVANMREMQIGIPVNVYDFQIECFPVSHDATESVGYSIKTQEMHIVVATDLGYIDSISAKYMREATHLIVESNYDEEMLKNGSYTHVLKERIRGNRGHLSNVETASFVAKNYQPHLQKVFLCHLSEQNNLPELATKTLVDAFHANSVEVGVDVKVVSLPRTTTYYDVFE
ncbi:MAG: MBL fold metallo-hydrolase [Paludibacteraceae bacterium]|nr:MBL fold metallo-hydrolase [Paludibacteraceae bacterium]